MRIVDKVIDNKGNSVSFVDFAEEYFTYHEAHWKNYFDSASDNLTNLAVTKNGSEQALLVEIIANLKNIIKSVPSQIPALINQFTSGTHLHVLSGNDAFRKEVEGAFNYSGFRKSAKASWLAERFDIKACLYCNAQFTLAIGKDGIKKKLLFQLDHFYDKSTYPFLSLTLGNLIPACSSCNIAKSATPFSISTHIHPFHEDANSKFDFYINETDVLEYLMGNRDYKLLSPKIKVIDSKITSQKDAFRIEDIYRKHTDVVEEIILKSLYYSKSKRDELQEEFKDLKLSQSIIDRFVLGNYSLDSEINKRPLAKLSKDIANQLKLLR